MKKICLTPMRAAVALCLLTTLATGMAWGNVASAAEDDFVSTEVGFFEAGVICAQAINVVRDAPDTLAGSTHVIEDAKPFVSKGRIVPAVLGFDLALRPNLVKMAF